MVDLIAQDEVSRLAPLKKILNKVILKEITDVGECTAPKLILDMIVEKQYCPSYEESLLSLYDLSWSTMLCTTVLDYIEFLIKGTLIFSVLFPSVPVQFNPGIQVYFSGYEAAEQDPLFLLFTQYQEDIRDAILKKPVTPDSEKRFLMFLEQGLSLVQVVLDALGETDFEKFKQVVAVYFDALEKQ